MRRAATRHKIKLLELSVMPEHVHCVAEIRRSMSISRAEALLKGYSSKELFDLFPTLKQRYWNGALWSAGRFSRKRWRRRNRHS